MANNDGQLSMFDISTEQGEIVADGGIQIVRAKYVADERSNWRDLFEGFDELYGITFSSGIPFMEKVMDMFSYVEMIFGCEGVMGSDLAAILSMETKSVEQLAKHKCSGRIAKRLDEESMALYVSRDTKSHEKIFILKAKDGRTRVITGSANMSASAFCGLQRENIICFDDPEAYDYYKNLFEDFKQNCADSVSKKTLVRQSEDSDYLRENIEEVPLAKRAIEKEFVFIEQAGADSKEEIIVADIKGMQDDIKTLLPKAKKNGSREVITKEMMKGVARKHKEMIATKKEVQKSLPKLHIDYDSDSVSFNGTELNMNPLAENVVSDINCLMEYMDSLNSFYGDSLQDMRNYYAFLVWYFATPFIPYLRYVGLNNHCEARMFPVFGMLYGETDGSKSTFVKLISKLMCGKTITPGKSKDFTYSNIEMLKVNCEGIPIYIDDLAKTQYDPNYEKIIKDDTWGITEGNIHYPAVVISSNKISSLNSDISKRMIAFLIKIQIDKEVGAKNARKINESIEKATNAFFCEYARRMFRRVENMVDCMKREGTEYFPDVFYESSMTLKEIFAEYIPEMPAYVRELSYSDYFGDKAVGKNAMEKIMLAWQSDKKSFAIDRKKNTLTYTYPDEKNLYMLEYIRRELPPALRAQRSGNHLVMELDKAQEIFEMSFKKGIF